MPNGEHGSTDHTRIETEVYYSQVLEEVHSMPQEATWREKDSCRHGSGRISAVKIIMILPFHCVRIQLEGTNYELGKGPSPVDVMLLAP